MPSGREKTTIMSKWIKAWNKFLVEQGVEEIVDYDLSKVSHVVDQVILGSVRNGRHMNAVCEEAMRWSKENQFGMIAADGLETLEWVVMDYGHYMVHIILPETRERIDLEGFWQELLVKKSRGSGPE